MYVVRGSRTPSVTEFIGALSTLDLAMLPCSWNSWRAVLRVEPPREWLLFRHRSCSVPAVTVTPEAVVREPGETPLDDWLLAASGTRASALRAQFVHCLDVASADESLKDQGDMLALGLLRRRIEQRES